MLFDGFRDRAEDHARLRKFFLEGGAQRDAVEHGVDGDFALGGVVIFGAFDARKDRLFFQGNAKLFVGAQKLRIDVIQRFWLFFRHRGRLGVVILRLEVDFRVIDHGPFRLCHFKPAVVGGDAPVGHPLRLIILFRDQANDVFVQPHRGEFHLYIGGEAVFVLVANGPDGLNRFGVYAVFDLIAADLFFQSHLALPTDG